MKAVKYYSGVVVIDTVTVKVLYDAIMIGAIDTDGTILQGVTTATSGITSLTGEKPSFN